MSATVNQMNATLNQMTITLNQNTNTLNQMGQDIRNLHNMFQREVTRNYTRAYNAGATRVNDDVVMFSFVGAPPAVVPATRGDLDDLDGEDVDALFVAFGEPIPVGEVAARRALLKRFLGVVA